MEHHLVSSQKVQDKDISPVHLYGMDCFEMCLVTIANYYGASYEEMFSEAWGFHYERNKTNSLIGNQLSAGSARLRLVNIAATLEKYDTSQIDEIIGGNQVSEPLIAVVNSNIIPWDEKYKNMSSDQKHFVVICGSAQEDTLIVTDPWYKKSNIILDVMDFISNVGSLYRLNMKESTELIHTNKDWRFHKNEILNRLQEGLAGSIFQSMRKFANDLFEADLGTEVAEFVNNITQSPLLKGLDDIAKGRRIYSLYLRELAQRHHVTGLDKMADKLLEANSQWEVVRNSILRTLVLLQPLEMLNEKLRDRILAIADFEENIANTLISLCIQSKDMYREEPKIAVYTTKSLSQMVHPDLTAFYNNKGLSYSELSHANLTSGEYIYVNKQFDSGFLIEKGFTFKLPIIDESDFDNAICMKQEILIDPVNCSNLSLLGCAEWGNSITSLLIEYVDGSRTEHIIKITDWAWENPAFDDVVLLSGLQYSSKSVNTLKEGVVNLYGVNYELDVSKKVSKIILPDFPNLHLFAITLS